MIIPVDYGQVNWKLGGAALTTGAEVTTGFRHDATTSSPSQLATFFGNMWEEHFAPLIVDGFQLQSVLVKFGPISTGPAAEVPFIVNGESSGVGCPPNVAILVSKITLFGGRAGRGRFYIPGINEEAVDSAGAIDAGELLTIQSAMDAFLAECSTEDVPLYVLHGAGSPLSSPSLIDTLAVSPKVATQRRRLRR